MKPKPSTRAPRWRPMRTAPKDGSYILLAYPSFSDNGEFYAGHGRWVECPHEGEIEAFVNRVNTGVWAPVPEAVSSGHWEVGYVGIRQHGGRYYQGYSYGPRSVTIANPLGWLPVPTPPKRPIR